MVRRVGGVRNGSSWWREVARICDGVGVDGGRWYEECIVRKIGNETFTFFWTDPWLGGSLLRVRFRPLFDLAENKSSTEAIMCALGWEEEGVAW